MIEKEIKFKKEAKDKILRGVDVVADAVKVTLGAAGRNVAIEDMQGLPHLTKDGVTVAKAITLSDPTENLGANIIKQASEKSADNSGDGTTTTCVLAQAIVRTAMENITDETNITQLKKGMESASEYIVSELKKKSKRVGKKTLRAVARISANNDFEIGNFIAEAYVKAGKEGVVTMEESITGKTYIETSDGVKMKKGYSSAYLITDQKKQEVVLDNPLVFVSDQRIESIEDIEGVLEVAIKNKRSILIISDIEEKVMNVLNINKAKGVLKVNVVQPEGIGIKRFELLQDLCTMTGATLASDETGNDLSGVDGDFLGEAVKCISTASQTVLVIDKKKNEEEINNRIASVKDSIDEADNKHNLWHYKDRLSRLSGGVAVVRVGAKSEVEMKEKKDRVDDAIRSTKAALEEGIVAGGGVALAQMKEPLEKTTDSFALGYSCVMSSLAEPFFQILRNASMDASGINSVKDCGYNVVTGELGDMFEMGIIDATKVQRTAIENAVSVSSLLLTTEVTITNKRA